MSHALLIESILFFKNEPVSVAKLATVLSIDANTVEKALAEIQETYSTRGIRLVRNGDEVMFSTAPEASEIITALTKEELTRDIGKAGLEVLSIITYKGIVSRREIDYIRGVNSGFIVRNLLIRGLIEKTESKDGERSFAYKPTFELLSYLGVSSLKEMPEYENVQKEFAVAEESTARVESESQNPHA